MVNFVFLFLFLFLILTLGFLSFCHKPVSSQLINGDDHDDDDLTTFLAIKKELRMLDWDDDNELNTTSNYCLWPHITCNSNHSFVEKLVFSHLNLQVTIAKSEVTGSVSMRLPSPAK